MTYEVEKQWTTNSGLRAVCLIVGDAPRQHRCGYVAVPKSHPLYGVAYREQSEAITEADVSNVELGKKSPVLGFTATCDSDGHDKIRRSPDIFLDVHGGLTYSSAFSIAETDEVDYPVPSEGLWWFGFDCAHYGDAYIGADRVEDCESIKSLEFVVNECEYLSNQLTGMSKIKEN